MSEEKETIEDKSVIDAAEKEIIKKRNIKLATYILIIVIGFFSLIFIYKTLISKKQVSDEMNKKEDIISISLPDGKRFIAKDTMSGNTFVLLLDGTQVFRGMEANPAEIRLKSKIAPDEKYLGFGYLNKWTDNDKRLLFTISIKMVGTEGKVTKCNYQLFDEDGKLGLKYPLQH